MLSVPEVAERLGVSPQRIHQRIKDESLVAERIGREWLIDEASLPRIPSPAGRPLSPSSAWALALLASSEDRARELLLPTERSRAKSRLRDLAHLRNQVVHGVDHVDDVADLIGYLQQLMRNRARRRLFSASVRDLDVLRADCRVRPSGVSLPESEIAAGDVVEGYIAESDLEDVVAEHLLDPARPGPGNVILHVVSEASRELANAVPVSLWLLIAADLVEHPGPREFGQSLRLLDGLEALEASGRLSRPGSTNRG